MFAANRVWGSTPYRANCIRVQTPGKVGTLIRPETAPLAATMTNACQPQQIMLLSWVPMRTSVIYFYLSDTTEYTVTAYSICEEHGKMQ